VVGNALRGVALTDYETSDGKASVELGPGVYDLSVTAIDNAGNSAVAVGDRLFTDGTTITKKKTGKFFGIALEIVDKPAQRRRSRYSSRPGRDGWDGGQHNRRRDSGNHRQPACRDDDDPGHGRSRDRHPPRHIAVNGGSPKLDIVSAVAQASPAGILVTRTARLPLATNSTTRFSGPRSKRHRVTQGGPVAAHYGQTGRSMIGSTK